MICNICGYDNDDNDNILVDPWNMSCPTCRIYADTSYIGRMCVYHGLRAYNRDGDVLQKAERCQGTQICGGMSPVGQIGIIVSGDAHYASRRDLYSIIDYDGRRYFYDSPRYSPFGKSWKDQLPEDDHGEVILTTRTIDAVWIQIINTNSGHELLEEGICLARKLKVPLLVLNGWFPSIHFSESWEEVENENEIIGNAEGKDIIWYNCSIKDVKERRMRW